MKLDVKTFDVGAGRAERDGADAADDEAGLRTGAARRADPPAGLRKTRGGRLREWELAKWDQPHENLATAPGLAPLAEECGEVWARAGDCIDK